MLATTVTSKPRPFDWVKENHNVLSKTEATKTHCYLTEQSILPNRYSSLVFNAVMKAKTSLPEGLFLKINLPILIKQEPDGNFFVEDEVFSIYGLGETTLEAINDYTLSLSEYFIIVEESLESDHRNLKKFEKLTKFISR